MQSFSDFYYSNAYKSLNEALITFGGQAYPKFNTVVIMAGGAGSGKGFVKDNLVGAEGYVFDVDALKSLSAKSPMIRKRVQQEFGVDITKLASDLKNPENVSKLHQIISDLKIDDRRTKQLYTSVLASDPSRKPNIIFDVTLKDLRKLQNLSDSVTALGYDKKDIHIVWVVNDIEIAKVQNQARARTVPNEILVNTHRGVSQTMADIINMGATLSRYMDGDIVFAFNKFKVDAELVKSGRGGQWIKKANYFYVKKRGATAKSVSELSNEVREKLKQYTPKNIDW